MSKIRHISLTTSLLNLTPLNLSNCTTPRPITWLRGCPRGKIQCRLLGQLPISGRSRCITVYSADSLNSTDAELKAAVESAQKAFPAWKATSVMARQQIMFKFTQLVRDNWDRLAASITLEQGKTFAGRSWKAYVEGGLR